MRGGLVVFGPSARVAVALGFGLVMSCSEGTTPDCSDAATPCGPRFPDGSARDADPSGDDAAADAPDDVDDAGLPDAPDAD